jgi:GNAT superfamily N-acetyltransferase
MSSRVTHTASRTAIVAAVAADLPAVQRLADVIWRRHYPGIISDAQIDYMLARGYAVDALERYLTSEGAGLLLATDGGVAVGFAAYLRGADPATMRLDKLYLLQEHHGLGLGRRLIDAVVAAARAQRCTTCILNVNKNNANSIRAYERCGFAIREAVVVDIGGGHVMDDYVMARSV